MPEEDIVDQGPQDTGSDIDDRAARLNDLAFVGCTTSGIVLGIGALVALYSVIAPSCSDKSPSKEPVPNTASVTPGE